MDYYDNSDGSESPEDEKFVGSPMQRWVSEHYDVLQELYWAFCETGKLAFGGAFFQRGGFHSFAEFVYNNTLF